MAVVASMLLFRINPAIFENWEFKTIDKLFQLRLVIHGGVPEKVNDDLYLVYVRDATIDRFCDQYHSGEIFTEVTNLLSKWQVSQIGFDIVFQRKCNFADVTRFHDAIRNAGCVFLPFGSKASTKPDSLFLSRDSASACLAKAVWFPQVVTPGSPRYLSSPPTLTMGELASVAKGIGSINITPDRDGGFRRLPLMFRLNEGYVPSLPLVMVCRYLDVQPSSIIADFGHSITLPDASFPDGSRKTIVIPVDEEGSMILNFPGRWDSFRWQLPIDTLLGASGDPATLESLENGFDGSIVIIKDMSISAADIGATPYQTDFPRTGLFMTAINTILTGNFLRNLDRSVDLGEEIFLLLSMGIFSLVLRPAKFIFAAIFLIALHLGFALYVFLFLNAIPHVLNPLIILVISLISLLVYRYVTEEREKIFIRKSFTNYFSPAILKKIEENPALLSLGGEKKTLTVMFTDIAGFTRWSSSQSPEVITQTLNEYFEEMAKIVFKYDGYIDKFIGDGLMAFFGDPVRGDDHSIRCAQAAIEMQHKVRELRERWEPEGRLPINIRIGIHSGDMIVGNMGSLKRMEYTVIGANVNLAQRLEANAPLGGILISEDVCRDIKDWIPTRPHDRIRVKGIDSEISVSEIIV
jgi:adenylate cyclase